MIDNVWYHLYNSDFTQTEDKIKYLLKEYGTSRPCNRFDIGNCIEFLLKDHIQSLGFEVEEKSNAKRIDIIIDKDYELSIKYSSIGDITLHNSNSSINKDYRFTDVIVMTPCNLYLLTKDKLKEYSIDVDDYLMNAGDSLKLKRTILKRLKNSNYPFCKEINITVDKTQCKNKSCAEMFYKIAMDEYAKTQITQKQQIKKDFG